MPVVVCKIFVLCEHVGIFGFGLRQLPFSSVHTDCVQVVLHKGESERSMLFVVTPRHSLKAAA